MLQQKHGISTGLASSVPCVTTDTWHLCLCYNRDKASLSVLQQTHGISVCVAFQLHHFDRLGQLDEFELKTAALTRSRKATQTRTVRGTKPAGFQQLRLKGAERTGDDNMV